MGAAISTTSKIGNLMYLFWKILNKEVIFFTLFSKIFEKMVKKITFLFKIFQKRDTSNFPKNRLYIEIIFKVAKT